MKLNKMSPAQVGLMQAIGVGIYCSLIAFFLWSMGNSVEHAVPEFLAGVIMLFLLVFSVAICGILVFGYPVYLLIQKDTRRALSILGYHLLYAIIILIIFLLIVLLIK